MATNRVELEARASSELVRGLSLAALARRQIRRGDRAAVETVASAKAAAESATVAIAMLRRADGLEEKR
jgi:hypothetical protein